MATCYVWAEQRTVIQFCFESRMTPRRIHVSPECITGFSIQITFKISRGDSMGIPPLGNTGKGTEVELVVSNDKRQTVRYLAEITG